MKYKYFLIVDTLQVRYETNFIQGLLGHSNYIIKEKGKNTFSLKPVDNHPFHDKYRYVYKIDVNNGYELFDIGFLMFGQNFHSNISVHYEKEFLYRDGFTNLLHDFEELFSLELENISRIDISLDTNRNLIKRVKTLFNTRDLFLVSCRSIQKQLKVIDSVKKGLGKQTTETITFRRKDNGYCLSIYDKTSQRLNSGEIGKDQLIDEYFSDRFDVGETIYRMEIRLRNKILKKYGNRTSNTTEVVIDNIDLHRLGDREYLQNVFIEYYPSLMEFRKQTHPNISKCEKITFIDLKKSCVPIDRKLVYTQERRMINIDQVDTKKDLNLFFNIYDNVNIYIRRVEVMNDSTSTHYLNRLIQVQKNKNPNLNRSDSYLE